jgi:hypothetical protein
MTEDDTREPEHGSTTSTIDSPARPARNAAPGEPTPPQRAGAPWWVVGVLGGAVVVLAILTTLGFALRSNSSGDSAALKAQLADARDELRQARSDLKVAQSAQTRASSSAQGTASNVGGTSASSSGGATSSAATTATATAATATSAGAGAGAPANPPQGGFSSTDAASVIAQSKQIAATELGATSCARVTLVGASDDGGYAITHTDVSTCSTPGDPRELLFHRDGNGGWQILDPKVRFDTVICGATSNASLTIRMAITEICATAGRA